MFTSTKRESMDFKDRSPQIQAIIGKQYFTYSAPCFLFNSYYWPWNKYNLPSLALITLLLPDIWNSLTVTSCQSTGKIHSSSALSIRRFRPYSGLLSSHTVRDFTFHCNPYQKPCREGSSGCTWHTRALHKTCQGRSSRAAIALLSSGLTKVNCGVERLLMLSQDWNNRTAYTALSCTEF